jgi:hypothetical protein
MKPALNQNLNAKAFVHLIQGRLSFLLLMIPHHTV